MKNKLLKILSLCLVLTMVFSFVACKGNEENVKDEPAKSSAEKESTKNSDADVPSDAQVVSSADVSAPSSAAQPEVQENTENAAPVVEANQASTAPVQEPEATTAPAPDANKVTEAESQPTKYSDVEIYKKDGENYAKTEDGDEVELSGDNLQKMMEEYSKVQGTGSAEEKDLLDRMQVILDNADRLQ